MCFLSSLQQTVLKMWAATHRRTFERSSVQRTTPVLEELVRMREARRLHLGEGCLSRVSDEGR